MGAMFGKTEIVVDGEVILNEKKSKGQLAREAQKARKEDLEKNGKKVATKRA